MEDRLKQILASMLDTDVSAINENASTETIDNWDSLKQMNVIVALEDEFEVEFNDEETILLNSYKLLLEALKNKDSN